MTETVLNGLLPISFAIALGWLSGRLGYLKREDADVFAVFVIRFALPMALFLSAAATPPEKLYNMRFTFCLAFGLMGTYLIALFTGLLAFRHDLRTSALQALVCAFPDMAYFGAPILAAVIGPEGFLAVLVGNIVTSMLMLPLTIILTQGQGEGKKQSAFNVIITSIGRAIINPIVWLPLLGVAFSVLQLKLPGPVHTSVDLIAKASGGASLFALGLMFCNQRILLNKDVAVNILLKNFLQPLLMFAGVLALGLEDGLAHQVVLTGAVPTATAAAMFALRNKTYTQEASSTIFLSTLLGLLTEAALIMLLGKEG